MKMTETRHPSGRDSRTGQLRLGRRLMAGGIAAVMAVLSVLAVAILVTPKAEAAITYSYTRPKTNVSLTRQKEFISYSGWGTHAYTVKQGANAGWAVCIGPGKDGDPSKSSTTRACNPQSKYDTGTLRAILYFGLHGPGENSALAKSVWPAKNLKGKAVTNNDKWAYMHVMCTYVYWGDPGRNTWKTYWRGMTTSDRKWFDTNVVTGKNSTLAKFNALRDKVPPQFTVFYVDQMNSTQQPFVAWANQGFGNIKLTKKSANPTFTNNNSNFLLKDALYRVYESDGKTLVKGTNVSSGLYIRTDANGAGTLRIWPSNNKPSASDPETTISIGTYVVKEATPSKGYGLDKTPYTVKVTRGGTAKVSSTEPTAPGKLKLTKSSSNESITNGNNEYTLKSGVYGIYTDSTCTKLYKTVTIDEKGTVTLDSVPIGNYWIRETSSPNGYILSTEIKPVTVNSGATAEASVEDAPQVWPKTNLVLKTDADTKKSVPQGDASLEGAQFTIAYYAGQYTKESLPAKATRTWVVKTDSSGKASLDDAHKVSGDAFYKDGDKVVVPLGTIAITETKAPQGYDLPKADPVVYNIKYRKGAMEATGITLPSASSPTASDSVLRGGVGAKKVDAATKAPVAGARFAVYNSSDQAVVVSGKTYAKGAKIMTIGPSGTDGVAMTQPNVLPYGTYRIVESAAPSGYLINKSWSQTVTVREAGKVSMASSPCENTHSDVDLATTLTSDGGKTIDLGATSGGTMVDLVRYSNLVPGTSYTLRATLHGKLGDEDLGEIPGAVGTRTFTPDAAEGEVTVEIPMSANGTQMDAVVAFEELLLGDSVIAEHSDINDANQTVAVSMPRINTTLTDENKRRFLLARGSEGRDCRLVDTIRYSGLIPGRRYVVRGELHLRDADGNDKGVLSNSASEREFVAEAESGETTVSLPVDLTLVSHPSIVAFERLYAVSTEATTPDGAPLAIDEDINNTEQTVNLYSPEIRTVLADDSGSKSVDVAPGSETISLTDTVTYSGLVADQEYVMHATIHGKTDDGQDAGAISGASAEFPFTPSGASGSVTVPITVPVSGIATKQLVAFETLTMAGGSADSATDALATHADITDQSQTVTARIPRIQTTLVVSHDDVSADANEEGSEDSKGEEKSFVMTSDADAILTDHVEYSGLTPNRIYVLSGELHARAKGTDAGTLPGTKAEAVVTPRSESGVIDINLTIPKGTRLPDGTDAVVAFETLSLATFDETGASETGQVVATHADINDENQTVTPLVPSISTKAELPDGSKAFRIGTSDSKVTVRDTVHYKNLIAGREYLLSGILHAKVSQDGNETADDGEKSEATDGNSETASEGIAIEASKSELTFTPKAPEGDVTLEMSFSMSNLPEGTQAVVAFEELYYNDNLVASHEDINDENQTVIAYNPSIKTELRSSDGKKSVAVGDADVEVIDTITYTGLVPGQTYVAMGVLHDKQSSDDFPDGDAGEVKGSEGQLEFTPDKPDGEARVTLKIPASYRSHTLVAFERLYAIDANTKEREAEPVAVHENIFDEAQSITTTVQNKVAADSIRSQERPMAGSSGEPLSQMGDAIVGMAVTLIASALISLAIVRHKASGRQS